MSTKRDKCCNCKRRKLSLECSQYTCSCTGLRQVMTSRKGFSSSGLLAACGSIGTLSKFLTIFKKMWSNCLDHTTNCHEFI